MFMRVRGDCDAECGFCSPTTNLVAETPARSTRWRRRRQVDGEAAERAAQVVERQAEIEQRAEDHVARGAGETIEIERLCQPSTPSVLAKAEVLHVREDHVIEHVDPHQDPGGRPAARSAARRRRSAPDRLRGDCETPPPRPRRPRRPRGTPRADARRSRRACRPTAPRRAAPDASCRATARRTARPGGCRTAAAGTPRRRAAFATAPAPPRSASTIAAPARSPRAPAPPAPRRSRARAATPRRAPAPAPADPPCGQDRVGQVQRTRLRPALPEHDGQQLVVAERRRAEPLQLLARPVVRRDGLHRTTIHCTFIRDRAHPFPVER